MKGNQRPTVDIASGVGNNNYCMGMHEPDEIEVQVRDRARVKVKVRVQSICNMHSYNSNK